MRSLVVVVVLPKLQFLPDIVQGDEVVDTAELVAQPSLERLDQAIILGLTGAGVVEFDPTAIYPFVQRFRGELRPFVHGDCLGLTAVPGSLIQSLRHAPA